MAVVMSMHWPEATLELYEQVRNDVKWEANVPPGAMFHVAWNAGDGFRALDLWESAEHFQTFLQTQIAPAVQRAGIQGQPNVSISPAYAIFAPNVPRPPAARTASRKKRAAPRRAPAKAKKARKTKAGTPKGKTKGKAKGKKRGKR